LHGIFCIAGSGRRIDGADVNDALLNERRPYPGERPVQ
jgi:hypothetical protein